MTHANDAVKRLIIDYENQVNDATTFKQLNDLVSHMLGSSAVLIALGYIDDAQEIQDQCSIALNIMRTL